MVFNSFRERLLFAWNYEIPWYRAILVAAVVAKKRTPAFKASRDGKRMARSK